MSVLTTTEAGAKATDATRWSQLIFGIICMVMIANLQYGWTLFVGPIDQKYHWGRAAIQVAFTIFVLTETWLVPIEGYLIDKFGPRVMICGSGVLVAIAWVVNSVADSLFLLYVGAAIGGIGAGVIYGGSVGNALKWFPDRRGLAAGLTAAGFGAGSAVTVVPIANMIQSSGYESAFLWFGLGQGIVVVIVALFLRAPQAGEVAAPAAPAVQQTRRDYAPAEVIRTPVFWVMYAMFVMVGAGGLMAIAQLAPIANDYKIAGIPVSILGLTLPALTFALTIDRVLNGICRPFFGWVSDQIGRENTMFMAFFAEGVGIYALLYFADNPVLFVILSGVVFFAWGEIYSLFPATCTDLYGRTFATTNYGMLYTAKGTASLLVPLANVLTTATGSWHAVFYVAAILNIVASVMALTLLKPMRTRTIAGLPPLPETGVLKALANPVFFAVLYLAFMVPTYILPWLGSNSAILNSTGMAMGLGPNPGFWIHAACLMVLIILAFMRGIVIGHGWLVILPVVAAVFDLVPGMNWVPMIPTLAHVVCVVLGVALRPQKM